MRGRIKKGVKGVTKISISKEGGKVLGGNKEGSVSVFEMKGNLDQNYSQFIKKLSSSKKREKGEREGEQRIESVEEMIDVCDALSKKQNQAPNFRFEAHSESVSSIQFCGNSQTNFVKRSFFSLF